MKRKRYDSTLPFDDNIPSAETNDINDDNFYDLFGAVFMRNARFAKKKPVPNIGDPDTPIDLVYKFYKYWDNFETWREWSQYFEYDPREAADRYERRYMEQENKRIANKYQKKERKRIITLVELAYKCDPRIKIEKEKEEQEKQRKKQEVKDRKDKQRKELEDKIKEQEMIKQREIDLKNEEERRLKEEKEALLKRRKELVKLISNLCEEKLPESNFDRYFVQEFSKKLKAQQQLENMLELLSNSTDADFKGKLEGFIAET